MTNKTYANVLEIYNSNIGSEHLYKRDCCPYMVYTDGVMDFAEVLGSHWLIDMVFSYMDKVVENYNKTKDYFYVVQVALKQNHTGYFEIYHEGYIDGKYNEHIPVVKQKIPYIDLPLNTEEKVTKYKFFLELSQENPLRFVFMLPREH